MMMFIRQILALEESNEARKLLESNQKKLEIREQQIKSSLEEKEVLLKEIHHRVKNNMQIISSLLSLQSRYVKDEDDGEIFKECQNRVRSMAMIHENLYRSPNLAEINLQEYLQSLITGLFSSYGANPQLIITQMDLEKVSVDIDKFISCGLIINELISNSLKYAFPSNEGEITLSLRRLDGNELEMVVADDGVGFPENLDFRRTESLGLQLVNNLVKQLDGEIELENTRGTKFTIKFPG
jgi:two-component sensor histidine kinase